MGRSGRAMIQALIDGETDPARLAALAHTKVRASEATLREALRGRVKRYHRFLLRLHLQRGRECRGYDAASGACLGTRTGRHRWSESLPIHDGSSGHPVADRLRFTLLQESSLRFTGLRCMVLLLPLQCGFPNPIRYTQGGVSL